MLHVIADFESELTAFVFSGLRRDDVTCIPYPIYPPGRWLKIKKFIDYKFSRTKLDLYYPGTLIDRLEAIGSGDPVLLFSIENAKDIGILRKYLVGADVHIFMWNPVLEHHGATRKALMRLEALRSLSGKIYTFDAEDARRFGFLLIPQPFVAMPEKGSEVLHDFCFVGRDKGRLDWLVKFKEAARDIGLSCRFHILPDRKKTYADEEKRHLSTGRLPYPANIVLARQSRCLIEVTQENQSGATLRSLEALFLGKKLITTRPMAVEEPSYDPSRVMVMEDIDAERLRLFMAQPLEPPGDDVLRAHEINEWLDHFIH